MNTTIVPQVYDVAEYDMHSMVPTGTRYVFQAETLADAAAGLAYYLELRDGRTKARVGPTGRVLYKGQMRYVLREDK